MIDLTSYKEIIIWGSSFLQGIHMHWEQIIRLFIYQVLACLVLFQMKEKILWSKSALMS